MKDEIKSTGGGLASYIEKSTTVKWDFTKKDIDKLFKEMDKTLMENSKKLPMLCLSYGDVEYLHEAGMLEDLMKDNELCIGSESLDFIRKHYE